MTDHFNFSDTICAPATTTGGALAIIRIDGEEAVSIVNTICSKDLTACQGGTFVYDTILDKYEPLDDVIISIFRAPHSFTGNESVEISCHGSSYIVQRMLTLLQKHGCRMARPGEFTQRAFMNGKMDLARAEAVADLIASSTAAAHHMAMNQMRGGFSKALGVLRDKLLHLCSMLELELDFSDHEDLTFASRDELISLTTDTLKKIEELISGFDLGNAIKNGIPVAIVGQPNAGKSTLLNALVGEEKAIVSDIRGTTRDAIEDTVNIDGTLFRFIDTAGLRSTTDSIEKLGIKKTFDKIKEADVILWVIDATRPYEDYLSLAEDIRVRDKKLIVALNKCDATETAHPISEIKNALQEHFGEAYIIAISAKQGIGMETLTAHLAQTAVDTKLATNNVIVSNARHREALCGAASALHRALDALHQQISGDLVSEDLRSAIYHLSDIVGDVTSQDVLNNIFSHFCVGK